MTRLHRRYQAFLGGVNADFEVRRGAAEGVAFYHVDVALREVEAPVHGSRLSIQLLDRNFRPLERLTPPIFDYADLLSLKIAGTESAFKFEEFAATADLPLYLGIALDDDPLLLGINEEEDSADRGEDDQDDREEQEDDRRKGEPKGGPKCCPDKFETPNGPQPTTRRPAGPGKITLFCRPWTITATFSNAPDPPCKCTCCRYRQRLKGRILATIPGMKEPQNLPIAKDYKLVAGKVEVVPLTPADDFVEDQKGQLDAAGKPAKPTAYGDRDDIRARPELHLADDYPDDCQYWAFDQPQVPNVPTGKGVTIDVDLTFEGTILDTCNDGAVVKGPNTWQWKTVQNV